MLSVIYQLFLFKYIFYFSIKMNPDFVHYGKLGKYRKVERRKITTHHSKTITFDILVN